MVFFFRLEATLHLFHKQQPFEKRQISPCRKPSNKFKAAKVPTTKEIIAISGNLL